MLATLAGITVVLILIILGIRDMERKARARKLLGSSFSHLDGYPIVGILPYCLSIKSVKDLFKSVKKSQSINYKTGNGSYWVLHKHVITLGDLQSIERVVNSQEATQKVDEFRIFSIVSDGIFISKGDKWRKMRRAIIKTLNSSQLDSYFEKVVSLSSICAKVLHKADGYINIHSYIGRFFSDLIIYTHFGLEKNDQEEQTANVVVAISDLMDVAFNVRLFNPLWHSDLLLKLLNRKVYKIILDSSKILYGPIEESARERYQQWLDRKANNGGKPVNQIFMDHIFTLTDELNMEQCFRSYNKLSSDVIIAGTDTTSFTTSAMFYYMAVNPEIQERVYQEVVEHFPKDSVLTKENLNKMTYLDMCVLEALRKVAPPASFLRKITADLPIGNYVLPKGANIIISIEHLHNSRKYWEKPTEFYPEHFLPEAVAKRPKMVYMPFGGGARSCPGVNYGLQAMKAVGAHIIREFYLKTNLPYSEVKYQIHFMKEIVQGYPIKLIPREKMPE